MKSTHKILIFLTVFFTCIIYNKWASCDTSVYSKIEYDKLRNKIMSLEAELEKLHSNVEICNIRLSSVVDHAVSNGNVDVLSHKRYPNTYLSTIYNTFWILYKTPIMTLRKRSPSYRELESLFGHIFLKLLPRFLLNKIKIILGIISKLIALITVAIDLTVVKLFQKLQNVINWHLNDTLRKFYNLSYLTNLYICKDIAKLTGSCLSESSKLGIMFHTRATCPVCVLSRLSLNGSLIYKSFQFLKSAGNQFMWVGYRWKELSVVKWRLILMLVDISIQYLVYLVISAIYLTLFSLSYFVKLISRILSCDSNLFNVYYNLKTWGYDFIGNVIIYCTKKIVLQNLLFRWFERILDDIFIMGMEANPEFALIAPEYLTDRVLLVLLFILISYGIVSYSLKGLRIAWKFVCDVSTGKISLFNTKPLKLKYRNFYRSKFLVLPTGGYGLAKKK